MMRLPGQDGKLMHAAVQINGAIGDAGRRDARSGARCRRKSLKGTPVTIHLYVDDVDAVRRARGQGRRHGARCPSPTCSGATATASSSDPFGHNWSVATPQREVSAEELQDAVKNMPTADCGAASAKG